MLHLITSHFPIAQLYLLSIKSNNSPEDHEPLLPAWMNKGGSTSCHCFIQDTHDIHPSVLLLTSARLFALVALDPERKFWRER